jgi:secondary thiamine-phosphate synthase enzyme
MNIIHDNIIINTRNNIEIINITNSIDQLLKKYDVQNGLITISTKHTTTAIIINEDEDGLKKDYLNLLEKLIPENNDYNHDKIDNNARSHLKSMITGQNQTIPIINNKLSLGTWQSIFFIEFDGPRTKREINITILF